MQKLEYIFGINFDDTIGRFFHKSTFGRLYVGPKALVIRLERYLGLSFPDKNVQHLRVEQYRQVLNLFLKNTSNEAFFKRSFEANPLGTASYLLQMRDELVGSGWNFEFSNKTPQRIQTIARVESYLQNPSQGKYIKWGINDRINDIIQTIPLKRKGLDSLGIIYLNEPLEWLPIPYQRLFSALTASDISISPFSTAPPSTVQAESDLEKFKALVSGNAQTAEFNGDGSLINFHFKHQSTAATFLARLLKLNPDFRPLCLISNKSRLLDDALVKEGLPSMGIASGSSARPSLQLLKLAQAFIWHPIDPLKVLEFATLPIQPLDEKLARQIALVLAKKPGLNSSEWNYAIRKYFQELETSTAPGAKKELIKMRKEYQFWFKRERYSPLEGVHKSKVIEIYQHLCDWAFQASSEDDLQNSTLKALSEQSRQIVEILETLPDNEAQLSPLQLEHIVRAIFEPASVAINPQEKGRLPFFHHPGNCADTPQELLWWAFTRRETENFFSKWYASEIKYLEENEVFLQQADIKNKLQNAHNQLAVLKTQKRLLLVIPEKIDGKEVFPNALYDILEASAQNLNKVSFHPENQADIERLKAWFKIPQLEPVPNQTLMNTGHFLAIDSAPAIERLNSVSPTDLNKLFYYPHQWFFSKITRFRKSSLAGITPDTTLIGNLAHKFFEKLLPEPFREWNKASLEEWIEAKADEIFITEGASLLMYGREPEKIHFINNLKFSAWNLCQMIITNGWEVKETEMRLEGEFANLTLTGKTDLVLQREKEIAIIDLKYRGGNRYSQLIKNNEDLQLILYAHLLKNEDIIPHTAYYIIKDAKMIARNTSAFADCIAIHPDQDNQEIIDQIMKDMKATLKWRIHQLKSGQLELRSVLTAQTLDDIYGEALLQVLEMKNEDAPFDDFKLLIK